MPFLALMMCAYSFSFSQQYKINIDLKTVVDDKVQVIYDLPTVDNEEIEFRMPKIVPGTYSISDFGRFLSKFKAMDKEGNELPIQRISPNRFLIKEASKLSAISYWVDDTFDSRKGNVIFEPSGTNIEEDENFVINTFGFLGYLQGMKDMPFEVRINHPKEMFGATALSKEILNDSSDIYSSPNYFDLADGPILYARPDTTTFEVGGAEILISIYSPNKVLKPSFVREQIEPTLKAQQAYLGVLPVEKYAFIIYLFDSHPTSGKLGALEHSYSSFYSLPETSPTRLAQIIRDVAAHEFFHIVTPLNIHSEEIGDFDFINPKMSQHLWMYEGVTEYAAGLAQVKYGEMSLLDYLKNLEGKIKESRQFQDNLPFTTMSKGCLDEYEDQYGNVYQKGALIGLSLDLLLRGKSNGTYGVQDLMTDLSETFGKTKSFKDDELFSVIEELTYPEVAKFFSQYVSGSASIPYSNFFNKVGLLYTEDSLHTEVSLGHINFSINKSENQLVIQSIDVLNKFGRNMGYKEGDVLEVFDGVTLTVDNYKSVFDEFKNRHMEGDLIKAVVVRENKKGKKKKVDLSAKAIVTTETIKGGLVLNPKPTAEQLDLRKAWIGK